MPQSQKAAPYKAVSIHSGTGPHKKTSPSLCTVVRMTKYPFYSCIHTDANGVLVHPWTKLRLRYNKLTREAWQRLLTSCPPIAVYSRDTKSF